MNALRRVSLLATLAALVVVVPSQSLAVVHVFVEVKGTPDFKIERPGSGVVIDASGLVVTHASLVAEGANAPDKQIFVQLADAARTRLPAHLVATRDIPALALLRVEPPTGITLTAAALSDDPLPGTPAMVLSFHDGEDHVAFAGVTSRAQASTRVTAGAKPAELPRADILLTDAAIQARSHGAALLDHSGALLGLCSAMWVQPDVREPTLDDLKKPSFGFVLPARVLRRAFTDDLRGLPAATPTPPTPEARATNLAAPAIVAVYAGKAARPLLDGGGLHADEVLFLRGDHHGHARGRQVAGAGHGCGRGVRGARRLADQHLTLRVKASARELLAREGYDPQFGARPLHRAIQKYLEDPLAEFILNENPAEGSTLEAVMTDEGEGLRITLVKEVNTDVQE